jgi:hypothetical protein
MDGGKLILALYALLVLAIPASKLVPGLDMEIHYNFLHYVTVVSLLVVGVVISHSVFGLYASVRKSRVFFVFASFLAFNLLQLLHGIFTPTILFPKLPQVSMVFNALMSSSTSFSALLLLPTLFKFSDGTEKKIFDNRYFLYMLAWASTFLAAVGIVIFADALPKNPVLPLAGLVLYALVVAKWYVDFYSKKPDPLLKTLMLAVMMLGFSNVARALSATWTATWWIAHAMDFLAIFMLLYGTYQYARPRQ